LRGAFFALLLGKVTTLEAARRASFDRNAAMMPKQQQYRTNDYKCTFIFKRRPEALCGQPIDNDP
jgi:hypothetical protein